MNTGFRKRLLAGDRLIGTMVTLGYPEMGEILAGAGFDWLFLDAEHSPMTAAALQHVMQGSRAEMPCLVRLAAGDQKSIKKALDIGAAGIISPMVNTAEAVQPYIEQGYTLIVAGTDALLLGAAAAEIFNQLSGR
ncbi:MAG: aldolase/citrate lyase family protein [Candidatus Promineifilaceae bacterium]